jgi:hypothetical protein
MVREGKNILPLSLLKLGELEHITGGGNELCEAIGPMTTAADGMNLDEARHFLQ